MQNAAAKLVLVMKKNDSATEALTTLHWLPIRARIEAKHEGLKSNNAVKCLLIPRIYCKTFADRAFSVYGSKRFKKFFY